MVVRTVTLQEPIDKDAKEWKFTVPPDLLLRPSSSASSIQGKFIKFGKDKIEFHASTKFPTNRILHDDDPNEFVLVSFGDLRLEDRTLRETGEYISMVMKEGLFLNGMQFRFYHHSNSQLRGRSCFMRRADSDAQLDERIYRLGDFSRIMNVAKRAKRIGLLFSEAQVDYHLHPNYALDIPDIESGDGEVFSDGCGLISKRMAMQVAKMKKAIFRGVRYTPCVYQIRYLGYKGVVMLEPHLYYPNDPEREDKEHHLHLRKSMKKFSTTQNTTFSVVDYSKPYAFGRLNNEIIVLLASLGITQEALLAKQKEYLDLVAGASVDPIQAVNFLSTVNEHGLVEKVLLDGLHDPDVLRRVEAHQMKEISAFNNDRGRPRSRIIVEKSRLIFGVCDPYGVLKEGQVHVKITNGRGGAASLIHSDVIVVRNPCLHPGDLLKLRAVSHPKLDHLVDCIVFASVAKPGRHPAPSMSSGGDLDGDKYFVCWDPDLVPTTVAQSYDYPPNKERVNSSVTRSDLANHLAFYNNASLARVAALHGKWTRSSPKGALSSECQELNALHSQSVDGARIKIPDRLCSPPVPTQPYIIDVLADTASQFAADFTTARQQQKAMAQLSPSQMNADQAQGLLVQILHSRNNALSEYELFDIALRLANKHGFSLLPYLSHFDFGAFTAQQKHAITATLDLSDEEHPYIWNSLFQSDLVSATDLYHRNLDKPFSLHRLYSSKNNDMDTFFRYLRMATQDYTRKVMILKTDERFAVAVFMRGEIAWDEDPEVNENVVVCSFLPHSSSNFSTYRPCTTGYRLNCGHGAFQLYNKNRRDSFVFITAKDPGDGLRVSIALQKISGGVQKQLGRVLRTPIIGIELHVVSNRDRVAHQLFDLWFEHVPTETQVGRFDREVGTYRLNRLGDIKWSEYPAWLKVLLFDNHPEDELWDLIGERSSSTDRDLIMKVALQYHLDDQLFSTYRYVVNDTDGPLPRRFVQKWMDIYPALSYVLLKAYPPTDEGHLDALVKPFSIHVVKNVIRSANELGIAALVALQKLSGAIAELPLLHYLNLLWVTAMSVRAPQLLQEILLVLNDCRATIEHSAAAIYAHKHGLGVAFDRAEEAADECPCNEQGRPRRQRTPPSHTKLTLATSEDEDGDDGAADVVRVTATVRVDARTPIRIHSHVRLQAVSKRSEQTQAALADPPSDFDDQSAWPSLEEKTHPLQNADSQDDNASLPILDGVVVLVLKGEIKIDLFHPPPPEIESMDWNLYHAGSTATSRAMMDAIVKLVDKKGEACSFYDNIVALPTSDNSDIEEEAHTPSEEQKWFADLNESQIAAVQATRLPLSLIWGPPGTGKTTVVIEILKRLVESIKAGRFKTILMTASTHNAVDNVLERFLNVNKTMGLLEDSEVLRVATDSSKVHKDLQGYTINARVGGDMNENNKFAKQAKQRLEAAVIVFTTCAGAGLGILRNAEFDIALIDEASQITEACALIPLVKGVKRAVLVGDHVQLRPTVKNMGKIIQFDVSLLERLYTGYSQANMSKSMLDIQYRFPRELALFPSREFYGGKLRSGITDSEAALRVLRSSSVFPWPLDSNGIICPTIFVHCPEEEDMGGMSKHNPGQVEFVKQIIQQLRTTIDDQSKSRSLQITVLSPYTRQIQDLRHRLSSYSPPIPCSTVDAFQGRESDIIVFSTVRANAERDIGFVDDARRMNVMWTRARLGLIIVGHKETMSSNPLWKRAIESCEPIDISV